MTLLPFWCCSPVSLFRRALHSSRKQPTHHADLRPAMSWFEDLVGFREVSPEQVRNNLTLSATTLESLENGRRMMFGTFETPSLADLRRATLHVQQQATPLRVCELVSNAKSIHLDPAAKGATIQVASQFNLLEMASPSATPEDGIGIYAYDHTQGPVCAMACAAGTIYRNYFVTVASQIGQSAELQIDCLKQFGDALGNADHSIWDMVNGYALGKEEGLRRVALQLQSMSEDEKDALREKLRIGVMYDTEVTAANCGQLVTQVYCSAVPVSYSRVSQDVWEPVARLVLEATYECALRVALINQRAGGSNKVYLTLVGDGVFGNKRQWILQAIQRSLHIMADSGLQVFVVSYRSSQPDVCALAR